MMIVSAGPRGCSGRSLHGARPRWARPDNSWEGWCLVKVASMKITERPIAATAVIWSDMGDGSIEHVPLPCVMDEDELESVVFSALSSGAMAIVLWSGAVTGRPRPVMVELNPKWSASMMENGRLVLSHGSAARAAKESLSIQFVWPHLEVERN